MRVFLSGKEYKVLEQQAENATNWKNKYFELMAQIQTCQVIALDGIYIDEKKAVEVVRRIVEGI